MARSCNVCYNCLDPGHSSKGCDKEKSCNACTAPHHRLLHKDHMPTKSKYTNLEENDDLELTSEAEEEIEEMKSDDIDEKKK